MKTLKDLMEVLLELDVKGYEANINASVLEYRKPVDREESTYIKKDCRPFGYY
jgi:hypothetical protein